MRTTPASLLAGALALALSALTLGASPAAAQTSLRMANWLPPTHPLVKDVMKVWIAEVDRATQGRVKVNLLDAPLGPPPAHYDFAANGVADVTYGVHDYTPGRFATTALAELPFLADSAEALSVAYWRTYEAMLAKANEHKGVHVISVFTHGPGYIFTKGRDLSRPGALKGAKLRIGGGLAGKVTTALGAVPVQAPSSKSYELISGGVADGILFPYESVVFFRLQDTLDAGLTAPGGFYNTSFFVVMNGAKWDALSAADKAAIDSVSGEALARVAGKAWDAADAAGRAAMAGKTIVAADGELLAGIRAALEPVTAETLKSIASRGVDAEAALAMLKKETAAVAAGR